MPQRYCSRITTYRFVRSAKLRVLLAIGLVAGVVSGNAVAATSSAPTAGTDPAPVSVVTAMVQAEKRARHDRTFFRYTSEERSSRTGGHLWRENVVETPEGMIRRLVAVDGQPLSKDRAAAEDRRIAALVGHPDTLRALNADRRSDEERVGRILDILPKAFLWTNDGMQGDCARISYRPNPDFTPSTYEERIIHGMAGTLLIRLPSTRLCAIDGHVVDRISFGYGLLGHIEKDSHFSVTRVPVTLTDWKNSDIEVHVDGKILLMKSISRDEKARHINAQPLPPNLTLAQAAALSKP
jgi:hypothetical protein